MSSLMLEGFSPADQLIHAIIMSDAEGVETLLDQGVSPNPKRSLYQLTPLQMAVEGNQLEIARLLINRGADIELGNQMDGRHLPPLAMASKWGHMDMVALLLQEGANVNGKEGSHPAPIRAAIKCGQLPVIQRLVHSGARVNEVDPITKDTPLHELALMRVDHVGILEYLFSQGPNPEVRNGSGQTPCDIAITQGNHQFITKYQQVFTFPKIKEMLESSLGRDISGLISEF